MNLFVQYIELHNQNVDKELLQDSQLTILINQLLNGQGQKNQNVLTDKYFDDFQKTQPLLIKDRLTKFTQPIQTWIIDQVQLWQIPQNVLDQLNKGYFLLSNLKRNKGKQIVPITTQTKFQDEKQSNTTQNMTINSFIDSLEVNKLQSLMNFPLEKWEDETDKLYENIPICFFHNDGLGYLRKPINNVNEAMLNILSQDSWIGAHQEPGALSCINLNHGPGECLWTMIDSEHVQSVFEKHPTLLKQEGTYYLNREILKNNSIPYKRFIQKPGDLIIVSPGAYFQIECLSPTVTTGWNFMAINEYAIKYLYNRLQLNLQYNLKCQLPVKSLFLDIYIHHQKIELQKYLEEFLLYETKLLNDLKKNKKAFSFEINYQIRNQYFCFECKQETFIYCHLMNQKYYCLKCEKPKCYRIQSKYNPNILSLLFKQPAQCSYHYCSEYESLDIKCDAKFEKPTKMSKKQPSPIIVKDSSTSSLEGPFKDKKYIQEEEKEPPKKEKKEKAPPKKPQDPNLPKELKIKKEQKEKKPKEVKQEQVKQEYDVKIEQSEVKQENKKKSTRISSQAKNNQKEEVIQIVDEPSNLHSYTITTRKRDEIIQKKKEEEKKDYKIEGKNEKQKQKFNSVINKTKLTEEELNDVLEIKQYKLEKIIKKGEKILTL